MFDDLVRFFRVLCITAAFRCFVINSTHFSIVKYRNNLLPLTFPQFWCNSLTLKVIVQMKHKCETLIIRMTESRCFASSKFIWIILCKIILRGFCINLFIFFSLYLSSALVNYNVFRFLWNKLFSIFNYHLLIDLRSRGKIQLNEQIV